MTVTIENPETPDLPPDNEPLDEHLHEIRNSHLVALQFGLEWLIENNQYRDLYDIVCFIERVMSEDEEDAEDG
jgi:hypothetical protein